MDHLVATAGELAELINLHNADRMDIVTNIFKAPAVRDLAVDIPMRPDAGIRYYLTLRDKAKNHNQEALTSQSLEVRQGCTKVRRFVQVLSGEAQPSEEGYLVSGDALSALQDLKDFDPAEEIGRAVCIWVELNYLLLNKPQSVRTWKQIANKEQRSILRADAKSPKKIYIRMRKLPPLTDKETWNEIKVTDSLGEYTRHCEAWGVRGHYRHYKSGRVVYIAPYCKGENRNNYKGREFELLREINNV